MAPALGTTTVPTDPFTSKSAALEAIVQAHGGTVQVRSEPGAGSVFELTLPLRPAPGAPDGARRGVPGRGLQVDWQHG